MMACEVCGAYEHEPCETCGQIVHVGAWPFCPHEFPQRIAMYDDQLPGGPQWIANMSPTPIYVENKTEWKKAMARHGVRHVSDEEHKSRHGSDVGRKRQWFS